MPLAHVFANMLAPPAILAERRVSALLISRIAFARAGTAVSANFDGRGSCGPLAESGSIM